MLGEENLPHDEVREFKCENGLTYLIPKNHCVFCKNCRDVIYDYINGPYMFICGLGCESPETCGKFESED